jgi:pimeloyl-ACP methyl ester carboxylesterase
MPEVELSAGPIWYEDAGDDGPVIVLVHGLLMTASLWDAVVDELGPGVRCVRPTMPLGAHRRPMRPDADLLLRGQVRLLVEFLERLELEDVTLVFNDWCGAQLLVAEGWDARVGRLVLASCEIYDNYPPGLPGRVAALAASLPGGLAAALKPLRFRALRRLPMTFGRRCCVWSMLDMLKPSRKPRGQIAKASSSNATSSRRFTGASTASS